ncbi:hypothetical protein ETAE_1901 [Edwardsiella piscicida]|uniref:Uncharacterized protein n=1 Tax=Edwardsiella piscicida TaxID=1263550 RepID=A0AAU8P3G2_EDWPI|nr:hypothetical protein ETAE_1901 [Edwardsiella tarda EIB202]
MLSIINEKILAWQITVTPRTHFYFQRNQQYVNIRLLSQIIQNKKNINLKITLMLKFNANGAALAKPVKNGQQNSLI